MKKTFSFGKIDYYGTGRKINLVEIEINLKDTESGPVFTASGKVWNFPHTDIVAGGQCLDDLAKFPKMKNNKTFKKILQMWEKHHLNDMHAGTQEQEKALKEATQKGVLKSYGANNYEESCNYLKSIGLYEVMHQGKPYKYGHGWIYYPIPAEDLAIIKKLFEEQEKGV